MKSLLTGTALSAMAKPSVGRVLSRVRRDRCAIVMLHRFAGYADRTRGHDVSQVRRVLASLRASGVRLLSLDQATHEFLESPPGHVRRDPAVAITVDDGYLDFLTVGLPVFEEFDCPVTCFVVPDVIDGKSWFWWDRLDWLLRRLPQEAVTLDLSGAAITLNAERNSADHAWQRPLVARLKRVGERERRQFLADVERVVGQAPPVDAPEEYRVMTWDDIRTCERRGVNFGAHSLTHAALSQCDELQARQEILGSAERVRAEVANASKVFCYPYGLREDFGEREQRILRQSSMDYAVSAMPGVIHGGSGPLSREDSRRWCVPRFAFDGRDGVIARQLFF